MKLRNSCNGLISPKSIGDLYIHNVSARKVSKFERSQSPCIPSISLNKVMLKSQRKKVYILHFDKKAIMSAVCVWTMGLFQNIILDSQILRREKRVPFAYSSEEEVPESICLPIFKTLRVRLAILKQRHFR